MSTDDSTALRRAVFILLITLACGSAAGRILAVGRVLEPWLHRNESDPEDRRRLWPKTRPNPMPMFSSNDCSRWATVRALVDHGTYEIGYRQAKPSGEKPYTDRGIIFENGWESVDKVLNPQTQIFYSSKPPLLATLAAGEYWLLKHTLGWSITQQLWPVVQVILFTFNLLPWLIYLVLLARLLDRYGATDWGKIYVLSAACFGTLLTPFLISFNNHTLAACFVLFALYPACDIWAHSAGRPIQFICAGFFSGLAVCMELPAAAFALALFVLLLWRAPRPTLACGLPAALVPLAASFLTNYLAIGEWSPAYSKTSTAWYQYEGSHWKVPEGTVKRGIDFAHETKDVYALHLLFGHHGLFSLTPVFLLAVAGAFMGWRRPPALADSGRPPPFVAPLTAALSVIVIVFYVIRTNNYGGWSTGPRWLLWLTPLWLLTMLPVADWLGSRKIGRALAYGILAVSALSVAYPVVNPWRQPWIYNFMEFHGWIQY